MKLLMLEAFISAVYVFDVSAFPFIHVPFYLLTLLYFASILEIYGMFRLARAVRRRLPWFQGRSTNARFLSAILARSRRLV
jgi:hypothetical protein